MQDLINDLDFNFEDVYNLDDVVRRIDFQKGREVHVWQASTHEARYLISNLSDLLSVEEQQKAQMFKFSKDRSRYIISRGILRIILGAYLREDPAQIIFKRTRHGKPYLVSHLENKSIAFNLTHSEDIVCYIVSREGEVGIDLEYTGTDFDWYGIAKPYFSPQEMLLLESISSEDRMNAFFLLWTRKEAHLKALGAGLSGLEQWRDNGWPFSNGEYALHSFHLGNCYQGALAINSSVRKVGFYRYTD